MGWSDPKTIHHGSATIIIHRPQLTRAEQAKREQQVLAAVSQIVRGQVKREVQRWGT